MGAAGYMAAPLVGIIMGSSSDWETMENAANTLRDLGVPYETRVVSAHRTPDLLFEYAATAEKRGIEVIIAGAGGAAHLPGMAAAKTVLPVLGVPVESKALKGLDSLLSIAQMPGGDSGGDAGDWQGRSDQCGIAGRGDTGNQARKISRGVESISNCTDEQGAGKSRSGQRIRSQAHSAGKESEKEKTLMTIGILGGGQLGYMLALAGYPLGLHFRFLDPSPEAPVGRIAHRVTAEYTDEQALQRFAQGLEVATYEFENVPVEAARLLAERTVVYPPVNALEEAQDRLGKKHYSKSWEYLRQNSRR